MITRTAVRNRKSRRGSVLLWVLLTVLLLASFILFGVEADRALDRAMRVEVEAPAQARAVAEAGIVDAYAWFRRQSIQPVTTFAPRRVLTAVPPINETDDPTVGLLREYEIAPDLWARYEVRLTVPAEPFTDWDADGLYDTGEPYSDTNGNGQWDAAGETRDVSVQRGQGGSGTIWQLVSHGTIFARPDGALPLGQGRNQRLSMTRVATEIRRLTLVLPAESAICSARGDAVTLGARSRILGGSRAGVVFASSTGSPARLSGSEVSGSPSTSAVPAYDGSIDAVFGVSLAELKSMADLSTTNGAGLPSPIGDFTLAVVDDDVVFNATRPLRGTGILVVLGDCTIADGSNSFFNGLLWVGGDLTLRAPSYIRGTIVAEGQVDVYGTGGDYAEVNFDDWIITELLALLGQYRHTKAVHSHDPERNRTQRMGTP